MIISHTHRYLFVELPHTASTAISRELRHHYDGQSILRKHAYYHEFLRIASAEERDYFVFSGIRNPLDEVVSMYLKYKSNHRENYTDPRKRKQRGGHVTAKDLRRFRFIHENDADFPTYFMRFYRLSYDNWSSLAHHRFDFIIRFERLQEDFTQLLEKLDIEQQRPLPQANPTAGKADFTTFYPPSIRSRARWVFGPFMAKWGYAFPDNWKDQEAPFLSQVLFHLLSIYRNSRRYLRSEG